MPVRVMRAEQTVWEPAADLYSTAEGWVIKVELAGVSLGDIQVEVQEDQLIIRGTRRDWLVAQGWRQYSMEISYSPFERILKIPCDLHDAVVSRECRDGMLLVHVRCKGGDK